MSAPFAATAGRAALEEEEEPPRRAYCFVRPIPFVRKDKAKKKLF
jgi:hypothetical protein